MFKWSFVYICLSTIQIQSSQSLSPIPVTTFISQHQLTPGHMDKDKGHEVHKAMRDSQHPLSQAKHGQEYVAVTNTQATDIFMVKTVQHKQ